MLFPYIKGSLRVIAIHSIFLYLVYIYASSTRPKKSYSGSTLKVFGRPSTHLGTLSFYTRLLIGVPLRDPLLYKER